MSDGNTATTRPPRAAVIGFVVLALVVSVWLMWRTNSSSAARECRARYQEARTAADTAAIDLVIPAHDSADVEAHRCGFIRRSARW